MLPDFITDRTHEFLAEGRGWYQTPAANKEVLTVHHTASKLNDTEDAILKSIFDIHHVKNGWSGFAYQYFYIPKRFTKGYTGKWIKLNNDTDVTWHDTINWDSIGICIHGYYHPDVNHSLEPEDFANIKKMLDWLCNENPQFPAAQSNVFAHRDRSATACCGDYLYPYISEYRTKNGNVDWGFDDIGKDTFKLDMDIPTMIEEKYELKEKEWYSKYWTFDEFIKDSILCHTELNSLLIEFKDLEKDNALNEKLLSQNTLTIQTQIKQIEQLQKDAQEHTVQMGLLSAQIVEANKQKDIMESERDALKNEIKTITIERDNLATSNKKLQDQLTANLRGYGWITRFISLFGFFKE